MVLLLALLLQIDPADQLRRQELALRLSELADAEKLDGFARAVQRELAGAKIEPLRFDDCWRPVAKRRWDERIDALVAAWDRTAVDPPTPGRLLFRARLDDLAKKPKLYRDKLEAAAKKYPGESVILWQLGKVRFEAGERGPAAEAVEAMGSLKAADVDVEEYHRLLVACYAETGRPAAATEHLRACREDDSYAVDQARFASKSKLPSEAARLYRLAIDADPDRISLRMGLVVALNASGEPGQAGVERSKLFMVDGKFEKTKVRDYFLLLPPEGRAEEIVRTIRGLEGEPMSLFLETTPNESRGSVMAEWERTIRDGRDWGVLCRLKQNWSTPEEALAVLARAEAALPKDPWILRERIAPLAQSGQFKEVADVYARLVEFDPDASKTGPRPFQYLRLALTDLALKDIAAAIPMAIRMLAEPGIDENEATLTRAALKPGWDLSGADFWKQIKKVPFPKPSKALDESLRAQIERLSSEEFEVRAAAQVELKKGGLAGVPVLLERIDDPDAEIRSKVREAIRAILTD